MTIRFRIPSNLLATAQADLLRRHKFAYERMGFLSCCCIGDAEDFTILAADYLPIPDEYYVRDRNVGARMNGDAIRMALQESLSKRRSIIHLHHHDHCGLPAFSHVDVQEHRAFMPDFFNVTPDLPHAAVVISHDHAAGVCWTKQEAPPNAINEFSVVGRLLRWWSS